jgi:hypothetical protein
MRTYFTRGLLSLLAAGALSVFARADDWTSPKDVSKSAGEFANATKQLLNAIREVDQDSPLVAEVLSVSKSAARLQDAVDKGTTYEAAKQDFRKLENGYAHFEAGLKKAHDVHHEKPVAGQAKKLKAAFDQLQAHFSGHRPSEKTDQASPGILRRTTHEVAPRLPLDPGDGGGLGPRPRG